MAFFKNKFESTKQDWVTPDEIFVPLNDEFHFTLDAAASWLNAKSPNYLTIQDDALSKDWDGHTVWVNPPYGVKPSLADWVKKAFEESLKGATVVMLLPARTNTKWFHDYCLRFGEVRFILGRPIFEGAIHGLPQPLCVVIFWSN